MKRLKIIVILVLGYFSALSQDSLLTLSEAELVAIVKQFHPVAKQALINVQKAEADITIARGDFDPRVATKISRKTFDGTQYYNHVQPELVIPTWFGIELRTGVEELTGTRTNPRETLGQTSFAGVSVPIASGLLMDKRRATLQQAKIYRQLSEAERQKALNDLLKDAIHNYWNWVQEYRVMNIIKNAVTTSRRRFEFVRTAFKLGDRPSIDTVEALTQVQGFEMMLTEAELNFRNAGLELSTYLWNNEMNPVELPASVIPTQLETTNTRLQFQPLEQLLDQARINHPELLQYPLKLDALTIERRLKFQSLLPKLNLEYNHLGKGYNILKSDEGLLFQNNYRYAINFALPIRLSEGRGEYRKAKLKIQETSLQQMQKSVVIETKVKSYYNEAIAMRTQVSMQKQQYESYVALQRGEETKFNNGESSMFLVNARETKALEALQKLVILETKYLKSLCSLYWSSGTLLSL